MTYKIFAYILPLLSAAIIMSLQLFAPHSVMQTMNNENGAVELLQFVIISFCFVLAVVTVVQMNKKQDPLMTGWIALASLCCLYVAGEEVSWGQHFAQWATPDFWQTINDQQETNLHNTSSWLDQKPRLILEIGVLIGGLIIPALLAMKPSLLPQRFTAFYPDKTLTITALLAVLYKVLDKLGHHIEPLAHLYRPSETVELYLFYFVFLYLILIRQRLFAGAKTPES